MKLEEFHCSRRSRGELLVSPTPTGSRTLATAEVLPLADPDSTGQFQFPFGCGRIRIPSGVPAGTLLVQGVGGQTADTEKVVGASAEDPVEGDQTLVQIVDDPDAIEGLRDGEEHSSAPETGIHKTGWTPRKAGYDLVREPTLSA
jgi:hypothetical protein